MKNVLKGWWVGFTLLLLVSASGAAAQDDRALEPDAVPDHGVAAGGIGFAPDPFRVQAVTGGGAVDASTRNLGVGCGGQISIQPDFRFTALTDFPALRFVFVADAVTADAVLIIRDAAGNYRCNDDAAGVRNPALTIEQAGAGDYNVWVGSKGARVYGDLYVTTRLDVVPGSTDLVVPRLTPTPTPLPTASPVPPTALNPALFPRGGIDALAAGFLPDPYWAVVTGGGALDVTKAVTANGCAGFASSAPDFRLEWGGASTRLRFLFAPLDFARDAALIVRDPAGGWTCNRNFAGGYTRPQIEFVNPAVGGYDVWVSDEAGAGSPLVGILYVTEKTYSPETVQAVGTAPTTPINGLTPAASAFVFDAAAPDPYAVPGVNGKGRLDVGAQNEACPGFYEELPSFGFQLPDATAHLRVFFAQEDIRADAALIVRMPDGTWYCNDDSYNTRQPTIDVIDNRSTGAVGIWVGSFDGETAIPGTLIITRGSASLLDPMRPAPQMVSDDGLRDG